MKKEQFDQLPSDLQGKLALEILNRNDYWAQYGKQVGSVNHITEFDASASMSPDGYGWNRLGGGEIVSDYWYTLVPLTRKGFPKE